MSPRQLLLLIPVLAGSRCPCAGRPDAEPPASIVRIALADEADERRPVALPTESENTVEVDFPWPVEDWAGRGFTPDADRFAGDFVIEAERGKTRIFVTPLTAGAHRVLHVILVGPGGGTRGVPIEFIPAPGGLAWTKVVFEGREPAGPPRPTVSLAADAPRSRLREPGPDSELGLLRTMRLMVNTTAEGAGDVAAANPALSLARLDGAPRSFGDFTISNRFALRDSTTDTLGLCASVANQTSRRLLFDPESWVVRVGDRVYPIRTVDFAGELEPGATGVVLLVVARGPDGRPTRLLPDNRFEASVVLAGSVNPRPVMRMPLEGMEAP
jgi:hypothetical protein